LRTGEECIESLSELCIERTHIGYDSRVILTNKYVDDRKLYLLKNYRGEGDLFVIENNANKSIQLDNYTKDIAINPYNVKLNILNSRFIEVIDVQTYQSLDEKEIPRNNNFNHILFNPVSNSFFLTDRQTNKVFMINEDDGKSTSFSIGKQYTGISERFIKKIALNPSSNVVYVAGREANKLFLMNGSINVPIAGLNISFGPKDAGIINCNGKTLDDKYEKLTSITWEYFFLNSGTICEARPTKGFEFVSRVENMDNNSTRTLKAAPADIGFINSFLDIVGLKPSKAESKLNITQFGNFTANFIRVPPPIPSEYWIPHYGIIASTIVGWTMPSIIGWTRSKWDIRKLNHYHRRIKKLYSDKKLDEKDIKYLDE
jgi:hypothetical protein